MTEMRCLEGATYDGTQHGLRPCPTDLALRTRRRQVRVLGHDRLGYVVRVFKSGWRARWRMYFLPAVPSLLFLSSHEGSKLVLLRANAFDTILDSMHVHFSCAALLV
eukprot:SAG11_NODE_114_length_16040_cov_10.050875_9_plen_107_part_00